MPREKCALRFLINRAATLCISILSRFVLVESLKIILTFQANFNNYPANLRNKTIDRTVRRIETRLPSGHGIPDRPTIAFEERTYLHTTSVSTFRNHPRIFVSIRSNRISFKSNLCISSKICNIILARLRKKRKKKNEY